MTSNKKMVTIAFCILAFVTGAFAQNRTYGLVFDDEAYGKVNKVSDLEGKAFGDNMPLKYSLKPYCPTPNNQKNIGSCVGQSIGYGAMTMMLAIKNKWTDRATITANAFSALYIYNQAHVGGCENGSRFDDAFNVLISQGNQKFTNFDVPQSCTKLPTAKDRELAAQNRVKDYLRLFDVSDRPDLKIYRVKQSLVGNKPAVIGMSVKSGMAEYKGEEAFLHQTGRDEGGHAMTVVGFDDTKGAFEILNSWGTEWGKNGFFWIKYDEFAKWTNYAYNMVLQDEATPQSPTVQLTGDFTFRFLNTSFSLEDAAVNWRGKYYETVKNDWAIGQRFQLIAKNIKTDKYVYVFSLDPKGVARVHFPKRETLGDGFGFNETPLIPYAGAEIVVPPKKNGVEQALTKEDAGTDYLCILFSDKALSDEDFMKRLKKVEGSPIGFMERFQAAFGDKLVSDTKIQYLPNRMSFSATAKEGFIAPIVLKVDSR